MTFLVARLSESSNRTRADTRIGSSYVAKKPWMRPVRPKIWGVEAPASANSECTSGVQQMAAGERLESMAPNVKPLLRCRTD